MLLNLRIRLFSGDMSKGNQNRLLCYEVLLVLKKYYLDQLNALASLHC